MPHHRSDESLRLLARAVIAVVVWLVTAFVVNTQLAGGQRGPAARAVLAAAGIAAFLAWLYVAARVMFAQDEFGQRIHLLAIALAFAATATVSLAADLLQKAGFVAALPIESAWVVMVVLWAISLAATSRYYR